METGYSNFQVYSQLLLSRDRKNGDNVRKKNLGNLEQDQTGMIEAKKPKRPPKSKQNPPDSPKTKL